MAFTGIDWERPNVDVDRMGEHAREASELLKALAHEGRLLILCDLLHGEKSVGQLETLLSRRQASVSQQLARLRLEGLVSTRRDGRTIYYAIANDRVRSIIGASMIPFARRGSHKQKGRMRCPDPEFVTQRDGFLVELTALMQKY